MDNILKNGMLVCLLFALFIFSCNSEDNDTDQNNFEETEEFIPEEQTLSIEEIFQKLDKAKFPQDWNYDYIYDVSPYHIISSTTQAYKDIDLIKNAEYEDSLLFVWKFDLPEIRLMCIGSFGLYAKGGSTTYNLVSFDKDFNKIDELFLAGIWAVSVENPYGGTSAGEDYQTAKVEYKDGTVQIAVDKDLFVLNDEGKFVKTGGKDLVPVTEFSNMFKEITNFPLKIDSLFIRFDETKQLNAGQIKTLYTNGKEIEYLYGEWSVKSFLVIDSLKSAGSYEEFLQGFPDGIVHSQASALGKVKLDGGITGYIWSISESSADKCPYSEGTYVYISFAKGNNILSAYRIAGVSGGGDPPMWSETKTYARIFKNTEIWIERVQITGEDEGSEDMTVNNYECILVDGVLKITN